jgi:tetratricopeptide (TPR) repeat protein
MAMTSGPSIDSQLRIARLAMEAGNLPRAESACREVLGREPENAAALHMLGRIAMSSGRGPEALDLLRRAVAAAPALAAAHADLGRLLVAGGQLEAAIESLRRALSLRPTDADLSDLGYILLAAGRAEESVEVLRQALKLNPTHVLAHCNLGAAERARKNFAEAAAHYAKAAALRPKMLEAHAFEGLCRAEAGDLAAARAAWERMLRLGPPAPVLRDIGNLLRRLGRAADAVPYLRKATQLDPRDAPTWQALSSALAVDKQFADAEAAARQALQLKPDLHEAHLDLGVALHRLDRHEEAAAEYRAYLQHHPESSAALANLAEVVSLAGDSDAAIALCRRAIELAPREIGPHKNLVAVLLRALRPADAVEVARQLVTITEGSVEQSADALATLAVALHESGASDQATSALREAIRINPDDDAARMNLGMLLLGRGELEEGFAQYEHREKPKPRPGLRPWDGSPTSGPGVLLRAEQGFGDTIQFVRYAPLVAARAGGGRVVVECPDLLRRLLSTAPAVDQIVTNLSPVAGVEYEASLVSLPHLIGTTLEDIPAKVPYLFPPKTTSEPFARALSREGAAATERRIGMVWAGNPKFGNDRRRSIRIDMLRPITSASGARFFSLQVGGAARRDSAAMRDMGITSLAEWLTDFCETAWAITQLDLVITVDTAVAHLAGALGKPVWVMLPSNPDWRWLRDREDTAWYPTMRLFRQRTIGDWQEVIDRVENALARSAT